MPLFIPNQMAANITHIGVDFLQEQGIRGLILDVDNTLTEHGSQFLRPAVEEWLGKMKQAGMKLTVVSNNTHKRVEPFAQRLGLDFVSMSCKPLTIGMTRAQKKFHLPPEQIAVIGDQIFTDIMGGNLKGMYTILVEPFLLETGGFFRLKRRMETIFVRRYQKRNGGKL